MAWGTNFGRDQAAAAHAQAASRLVRRRDRKRRRAPGVRLIRILEPDPKRRRPEASQFPIRAPT